MDNDTRRERRPVPERPTLRGVPDIRPNHHPTNVERHTSVAGDDAAIILERLSSDMPMDLADLRADMAVLARSLVTISKGIGALAHSTERARSEAQTASSRSRRPW